MPHLNPVSRKLFSISDNLRTLLEELTLGEGQGPTKQDEYRRLANQVHLREWTDTNHFALTPLGHQHQALQITLSCVIDGCEALGLALIETDIPVLRETLMQTHRTPTSPPAPVPAPSDSPDFPLDDWASIPR